jgi:hypothetical protein
MQLINVWHMNENIKYNGTTLNLKVAIGVYTINIRTSHFQVVSIPYEHYFTRTSYQTLAAVNRLFTQKYPA